MYKYNEIDRRVVHERVEQFRGQVRRRLEGELSEDQFRPLRLMNGLYLQRHAYMLRVAIPYGLLSSVQLRTLASIARRYDRGWAHFTTRQNLQYNWPKLAEVPDLLAELAEVEMHAIQTSGNCIRNISSDHLAGVAADEIEDPRPYCEILRQWSSFHPEFSYLPRKFKIAFTGARRDRAAIQVHDIGFRVVENETGERGFEVIVGGGLGRTPILGPTIREFLPKEHLLSYTESILRVYNLHGDRDNKFKARIKILVKGLGPEEFRRQVEEDWEHTRDSSLKLDEAEIERIRTHFPQPNYLPAQEARGDEDWQAQAATDAAFGRWLERNTLEHKRPGYRVVVVSLKHPERPPGDATAEQMELVAELADRYSFGELCVTHEQNLVLRDVAERDLVAVWRQLEGAELAVANVGTLADMICCPGLDFCALANAGSIGVARRINERFADLDYLHDLGPLKLKMSGCINSCGHHHVGHIGILGINKRGEEFYQIMLGGSAEDDASLGKWLGPAIAKDAVCDALEAVLQTYVEERQDETETFLDCYRRIGPDLFKERVYHG